VTGSLKPFDLALPTGRLHAWARAADRHAGHPALLCLAPLPRAGDFFATAAPLLGRERALVCPDTPGFGGSEPGPTPWSVEGWASAVRAALDVLFPRQPVDVLGFHTGCLVGAELAAAAPERVRRLVLVDVPYFDGEQRSVMADHYAEAPRHVGKPHAAEGFRAAFAWDPKRPFRALTQPTLVIGTGSSLHGPSEAAARAAPGANFLGRADIATPVFEAGTEHIVDCCTVFLGQAGK
jgi:pimeloyl-ACP methyl ester carboxylesterase